MSAQMFLDTMYGDPVAASRASSRAATPMVVRAASSSSTTSFSMNAGFHPSSHGLYPSLLGLDPGSPKSIRVVRPIDDHRVPSPQIPPESLCSDIPSTPAPHLPSYMQATFAKAMKTCTKSPVKGETHPAPPPTPQRTSCNDLPSSRSCLTSAMLPSTWIPVLSMRF